MTQDPDPFGNGFIASLARPGGNITGLSNLTREISGKQLELLKEICLSSPAWPSSELRPSLATPKFKRTELVAGVLEVQLQYLEVRDPKDIETAFRAAGKGRADAVLGAGGCCFRYSSNTGCQNLRQRAGSRRYTTAENMLWTGGL